MRPEAVRATHALTVERALRSAARAGNRLLAGHRASVDVSDPELRDAFLVALSRMGVRVVETSPGTDFVFTDFAFVDTITIPNFRPGADRTLGLPCTTVAVDGGIDSGRFDDAASKIEWAARGMPTTARLARSLSDERPPVRIAVSLVLEPKTAAFALALADAGCEVAVFSAVSETDPHVAQALAADGRVRVFAPTTSPDDTDAARIDAAHARAVLEWGIDYLIDDGSHLIRLAHTEHPDVLRSLRGAAEETTSGVRPLREMVAQQALRIPVIAVNDARTKTDFDNLIGTGQSCVFAIADCAESAAGEAYRGMWGTRWTIFGYGPVGVGVARFASALGAEVTVVERDPVRALSALHDGFEARQSKEGLARADVIVSATGVWHTIDAAALASIPPGAVVAVAGGIDEEIALNDLQAAGWTPRHLTRDVDEWCPPDGGQGILVLAGGGGVNYSAAEGNPIEVMDLSFATQIAALARLMREDLPAGVHTILAEDERLVAAIALEVRGGTTDPEPPTHRPGGAAQPWTVHRYRHETPEPLDSSE